MSVFIVFEGIDGSGKTVLAKALASDIGGLYIATPPPLLGKKSIRGIIDKGTNLKTRFLYYLLGDSFVSDQVRELRTSRPVVCDRYIHSTIAIHQLLGVEIPLDINLLGLVEPDIAFFTITSDEHERRTRVEKRGKRTAFDIKIEDEELRRKYISYFHKNGSFVFIDTAHQRVKEVLEKIKEELSRRGLL